VLVIWAATVLRDRMGPEATIASAAALKVMAHSSAHPVPRPGLGRRQRRSGLASSIYPR
jgi:hypothetical protein